jgi:3-oxoacyl-[acyl-carrier-protein] synthase II
VRRVVITGVGPVTPVGTGRSAFWQALSDGRSGVGPITRFDASGWPVSVAAEVGDLDAGAVMGPKEARKTDRSVHLAVAAARLAVEDAGGPGLDPDRTAVVIGTGIGGLSTFEEQHRILLERGPDRVSPFLVPAMMPNAPAGHVAMDLGLRGPNLGVVTACASSAHAIGEAVRMLRAGDADAALAGGTEAVITPLAMAGFARMQALSTNPDPATASRPFDALRDGFVLGEGACVLVLEEAGRAERRGAHILAEVAGYGATADAHHVTQPHPEGAGAVAAMRAALADAGETPEAVGYVNAHGTSTPLNDAIETLAIHTVFAPAAASLAVSSTKSMTGHLLGAAGATEAAATALAILHGLLPPTINLEHSDSDCDLDYVPKGARPAQIRLALSNSFGFGGQNACLALRRWDG